MTSRANKRGRLGIVVGAIGLLAAGCLLALGLWFLWRPEHVVWARNAYGMAEVGAWTGWDGFQAYLAYGFFEWKGRTALTAFAVLLWLASAWAFARSVLAGNGSSR